MSLDLGPLFRSLSTDPELGNIAFRGQFCLCGWAAAMFGIYLIYIICLNNCLGNTKAGGTSWPGSENRDSGGQQFGDH